MQEILRLEDGYYVAYCRGRYYPTELVDGDTPALPRQYFCYSYFSTYGHYRFCSHIAVLRGYASLRRHSDLKCANS